MHGLTSQDDLAALFENLAGHRNRATLALYFHGGLNSRDDGLARCNHMLPWLMEAGAYPVFFAWESAYGEVIGNQLAATLGEPLFHTLYAHYLGFARNKIRGANVRGEAADPGLRQTMLAAIDGTIETEAALTPDERRRLYSIKRREASQFETALLNDPALRRHCAERLGNHADDWGRHSLNEALRQPGGNKGPTRIDPLAVLAMLAIEVLTRVFSRFATGRDHGMRATIFEELAHALMAGKFLSGPFALMKHQIDQAFAANASEFGGSAFLERLRQLQAAGHRPRILLIGHSAGAIYVCRFIEAARNLLPDQRVDVVLLTPGVSFRRFAATLDTGMQAIGNFRSYALDERTEELDPLDANPMVRALYPRSTLYFASGVLEYDSASEDAGDLPLLGMQRYFNRQAIYNDPAITKVRDYLAQRPDRQVWIARDGEFGEIGHAAIEDNPLMRRHLARIVSCGFDA